MNLEKNAKAPGKRFRGSVRNALLSLLYLVRKHENCRVILSFVDPRKPFRWSGFAIKWTTPDRFHVPGKQLGRFTAVCRYCVMGDKSARWLAIPLTLRSRSGDMHANFLLYDFQNHLAYRFEPYGLTSDGYDGEGLDEHLQELFRVVDPEFRGKVIINTLDADIQGRQENEADRNVFTEPGYCAYYSVLFADMHMQCGTCTTLVTSQKIKSYIERQNVSITHWIRSYAELMNRIYRSACLTESMFLLLIHGNRDSLRYALLMPSTNHDCHTRIIRNIC